MHIEMFPYGIIHAECFGGEIDLLVNQRIQVGFFPWRFVDGESCIGRAVAFLEDKQYEDLMAKESQLCPRRNLAMLTILPTSKASTRLEQDNMA